jgi:hypothetical protein
MITCVVTFRRNHHRPHRNPSRPSALLSRPKLHSCKPFALYLLQSHVATNPFFCTSYQKQGSALPPASFVNSSDNSLVPGSALGVSPLLATLVRRPTSVASKGLTETLNPLLATLARNPGEGSITSVTPCPIPDALEVGVTRVSGHGFLPRDARGAAAPKTTPPTVATLVLRIPAVFAGVRKFPVDLPLVTRHLSLATSRRGRAADHSSSSSQRVCRATPNLRPAAPRACLWSSSPSGTSG